MVHIAAGENDPPIDSDKSVFEVVVRAALAGAPWKDIYAGVMEVNNIAPTKVEQEVERRQALLRKPKTP